MATPKTKKELKSQYFQNPQDLCDFVNNSNISVEAICSFDRFIAIFYFEK